MFLRKFVLMEEADDGTGQGAGGGEGSLIDGMGDNNQGQPGQGGENEPDQYAWFWSEGQQGEGEPPDWFKGDKYKSVADQAKAYTEAEKRLGAFTGAPDEYELSLPESYELPEGIDYVIDPEDPLAQAVTEWGKQNGLSQKALSEMLAMYADSQVRDYNTMEETVQSELEQLGENRDARLNELAKWGQNNLDPEMFENYKEALTSAAAVRTIEYLIDKTRNNQMPDPTNINPNLLESKRQELAELEGEKDENGQLKWLTDENHRKRIEALRREVSGTGEYRQIVG